MSNLTLLWWRFDTPIFMCGEQCQFCIYRSSESGETIRWSGDERNFFYVVNHRDIKIIENIFGQFGKCSYFCTRFRKEKALKKDAAFV